MQVLTNRHLLECLENINSVLAFRNKNKYLIFSRQADFVPCKITAA